MNYQSAVTSIGIPPWQSDALISALAEFAEIYERRPIRENVQGMRSVHMFYTWFILRTIQPSAIIESGVWRGQGTWIMEQACPEAQIYSIDVDLSNVEYRSRKSTYFDRDFTRIDWSGLPTEKTLIFFDDHQNAYERVKSAHWFGFREMIFDDNYAPHRGDCYSLKHAFAHAGFNIASWQRRRSAQSAVVRSVTKFVKNWVGASSDPRNVPANDVDARYLHRNIEVYVECPPIFRFDEIYWGEPWDAFDTPKPLLSCPSEDYHEVFLADAKYYNWMCYVRLK